MARILIVEDSPPSLMIAEQLLHHAGHEVVTATDGAQGIEAFGRERFDLALIDIWMPGIDGFEVARRLRADATRSKVPLVALSAVQDRERIIAGGFDGHIPKPIYPEVFAIQIDAFLPAARRVGVTPVSVEPAPAAEEAPVSAKPRIGRILVVDNTPSNLLLMRAILEPSGYELVTASAPSEALALAKAKPPDVIFSDVHMPDIDGFAFLGAVRSDPVLTGTPFCLISASAWSLGDEVKAKAMGADRYFAAVPEPDVILRLVKQLFDRRPI